MSQEQHDELNLSMPMPHYNTESVLCCAVLCCATTGRPSTEHITQLINQLIMLWQDASSHFVGVLQKTAACVCAQPGKEMVAAGYCMYGNNCCMVLSIGSGTHIFTLDPSIGEFVLTSANIQIPSSGSIYSINEGNEKFWQPEVSR